MTRRIVVGITGASGAAYARRMLALLAAHDIEIHLSVSTFGRRLLFDELGLGKIDADALTDGHGEQVKVYNDNDIGAGGTIAALAAGLGLAPIGFAASPTLAPALAMIALLGAFNIYVMTSLNVLLQHLVDDAKRGRVMSLFVTA